MFVTILDPRLLCPWWLLGIAVGASHPRGCAPPAACACESTTCGRTCSYRGILSVDSQRMAAGGGSWLLVAAGAEQHMSRAPGRHYAWRAPLSGALSACVCAAVVLHSVRDYTLNMPTPCGLWAFSYLNVLLVVGAGYPAAAASLAPRARHGAAQVVATPSCVSHRASRTPTTVAPPPARAEEVR